MRPVVWVPVAPQRLEPHGWHVYVAWSDREASGRPLYVGVSGHIYDRISQQLRSAPWRAEVEWFQVYPVATAVEAEQLEYDLIGELDPIHNLRRGRVAFGRTFDRNRALQDGPST